MDPPPSGPILVVESDRHLGMALAEQLMADGYRVELAGNAQHARILARESAPKLALLGDLDTPRGAICLLEEIRGQHSLDAAWERSLPTIVISSSSQQLELLRAFEAGADDFLAKPVAYLELRARVRAILHRADARGEQTRMLEVGPLAVDQLTRTVTVQARTISLRRMEFELLVVLAREPARVYAKGELLRAVWGFRSTGSTRTLDSHASRLRRKLDVDGSRRWVINVWGVGYRLT